MAENIKAMEDMELSLDELEAASGGVRTDLPQPYCRACGTKLNENNERTDDGGNVTCYYCPEKRCFEYNKRKMAYEVDFH